MNNCRGFASACLIWGTVFRVDCPAGILPVWRRPLPGRATRMQEDKQEVL